MKTNIHSTDEAGTVHPDVVRRFAAGGMGQGDVAGRRFGAAVRGGTLPPEGATRAAQYLAALRRLPSTPAGLIAIIVTLLGVVLMLVGMALRILTTPAAPPIAHTAALATAAVVPSAVPAATSAPAVASAAAPTATSAPAGIAVGFTPDQLDQQIAPDAPVVWLGAVQEEQGGDRLCYIGTPHATDDGGTVQAQLWARCADVHLDPPPPTPAPTQPVVYQPVAIPAAPAPAPALTATAPAAYDPSQPIEPDNCPLPMAPPAKGCEILVLAPEGGQ